MKTFQEYEAFALDTTLYPNSGDNIVYPALGLVGEAGEFADKVKKLWRNTGSMSVKDLTPEQRLEYIKELGDALWYVTANARELGSSLEEVATENFKKLSDRRARGVIKSEGDNR